MSTFKKLLALTLALAMVLSVSAFAGYKADTYKDAASIDEDCEEAIELLYALDIMVGSNDEFRPTANITRAEIAKMIYVILNYGKDDKAVNYTGASLFSDVEKGSWYEGYVNYCATIRLIQGDGTGKFNPNDYVTTAAVAKMLLTAMGYVAEDRGYVGANWEKNVLADANLVGLLSGYNYSTTGYAPRQWIAVMFYNALLKGACVDKMTPGYGLIYGPTYGASVQPSKSLGEKYYGLKTYTGYLYATRNAVLDTIDNSDRPASGYVIVSDGDGYIEVKASGLTAADLGQQFHVIYKEGGKTVYSVRNTGKSVVAEALGETIDKDLVYGTGAITNKDSAQAKNHYEYTVDETQLALEETIRVLTNKDAYLTHPIEAAKATSPVSAMDKIITANEKTSNLVKVIDRNGDGEIDYVIETVYAYATVTKVNSYSYGDYVWLQFADNKTATKYYVDDSIICDEDLVVGNYVKVAVDYDSSVYALEVLDVESDVTVTKIKSGVYTISGADYRMAKNGWNPTVSLKDDLDIVYDGDLLVYAGEHVTYVADLDALNEMLCVVTNTSDHYVFNNIGGYDAVKVLTIDGNEEWYRLYNDTQDVESLEGNLYWLTIKSNGSAWLRDYTKIDNCAVADPIAPIEDGTLKATETKTTYRKDTKSELMYVDTEATFFLYDTDEEEYSIGTVGELGLGTDNASDFQGFVNADDDWTYMVAGLIKGDPSGASAKGKGYALTVGDVYTIYDEDDDETYNVVDVMFPGDEEATTIILANENLADITVDELFYYNYVGKKYTLSEVKWTGEWTNNSGTTSPSDYASGYYEIYNVDGTDFTAVLNDTERYDVWTADSDGVDILVHIVNWSAAAEDGERKVTGESFAFAEELDGDMIDGKYDGNTKYFSDFSAIYEKTNEDWDREYSLLYVTIYVLEDYVTE